MIEIHKPLLDERQYRCIQLDNRLNALLVHDPVCDKASAAMDVNVGSFSDPDAIPGLAHFLEHMLFMGTAKYPKENDYSEYLSKHGGHSNAFTSGTNTNYYFDVGQGHLDGALDRFAQFFIAPLFNADGVDREMNAVDSEYKKNLQMDSRRFYQTMKIMARPDHPLFRFDIGNLETLKETPLKNGTDILKELREFHAQYYSANLMKLVVLGRESLDQLEALVREKFTAVENKNTPVPSFQQHPFDTAHLRKEVFVRPVKDIRRLKMVFAIPAVHQHWRAKPLSYIAHLVGHESEGSILSLLKQKGWATSLSAGQTELSVDFELFSISIDLTKEGLVHYVDVLTVVFEYIRLVKQTGPQQWIFDECKQLADIAFQFKEKSAPASYASRTAEHMQHYPPEYYLDGPYVLERYEPNLIEEMLGYLEASNCIYFVSMPHGENVDGLMWKKEKWYGIEYTDRAFPGNVVDRLSHIEINSLLHMPNHNEFLPKNFDVQRSRLDKPQIPALIHDDAMVRLWHKKDDTFWVPKANVYILVKNPFAYQTPYHAVMTKLFTELVKDSLSEYSYMAECAGLHYGIDIAVEGVCLVFSGYNDKLPVLMERVLSRFRWLTIDPDRFNTHKERLERNYTNFEKEPPYQHASFFSTYMLQQYLWTPAEKLHQLKYPNLVCSDSLKSFINLFFEQIHLEMLFHGNMSKDTSKQLSEKVTAILTDGSVDSVPDGLRPFESRCLPEVLQSSVSRMHSLPPRSSFTYVRDVADLDNVNSAIEYYLQVGEGDDLFQRCRLLLMAHMLQDPTFNQLRTKEQLGYIVWTTYRRSSGVMGMRVIIQSERDALYLEHRIELFLEKYLPELQSMADEDFIKHRDAIITILTQRDQNLNQESSRWWRHIHAGTYEFNEVDKTVEMMQTLSKDQIIDFFVTCIWPKSKDRRKLSIHLCSQKTSESGRKVENNHIETIREKLQSVHGIVLDENELRRLISQDLTISSSSESLTPAEETVAQELDINAVVEKVVALVSTESDVVQREPSKITHPEKYVEEMGKPDMQSTSLREPAVIIRSEKQAQLWKKRWALAPVPISVLADV